MRKSTRSAKGQKVNWESASDVKSRITLLSKELQLDWIDVTRIYCMRSSGSSSRAIARIWGLGRIWQMSLKKPPSYIIEVLSERYDRLTDSEKDKVLLHEIAHIPKNFSGSLMPHTRRGRNKFSDRVRRLVVQYMKGKRT